MTLDWAVWMTAASSGSTLMRQACCPIPRWIGTNCLSSLMHRQKKTPPKAGSLGFSLDVLPSFHSEKKPSSQMNNASEILLSKSLRIS